MDYLFLATMAFIAGFIDAVVGGGGLIQLPALLINSTNQALGTVLGTNKIAAFAGTSVAAINYSKKFNFQISILLPIAVSALVAAYAGAQLVHLINPNTMKPIILGLLIFMIVFSIFKKNPNNIPQTSITKGKNIVKGVLIGVFVGFYDGFFGPGTGTFLVFGMVWALQLNYLQASAYAKLINCFTNIGALCVFIAQGNYVLLTGLWLAGFNMAGNYWGSTLALQKGNSFVKWVFVFVATLLTIQYGLDVFGR